MSSTDPRPGSDDLEPDAGTGTEASPADASAPGSHPPHRAPALSPARRRDRLTGFSIIAGAFAASLVISWRASEAVKPRVAPAPGPPTSEGLEGFPQSVDPLSALARARELTARDQLRKLTASGVGVDGSVDLTRSRASIRYEFDSAPGEGPEPPRPAGTLRRGNYCGRQTVHLRDKGLYVSEDRPRTACRPSLGEPLPEPRCQLSEIWAQAVERGVPSDAFATIEYFRAQGGPAWKFSAQGSRVRFTLFGDCETLLEGKAARALGP